MSKSIKVHPKKRRGRPATGKDPLVSARLPQSVIDQVHEWAATNEASRSEAIRRLVELGLSAGMPKSTGIDRHALKKAAATMDLMSADMAKIGVKEKRK
jgi:Arc/MetJ-type ribon-helix-helix transcriptional regulator